MKIYKVYEGMTCNEYFFSKKSLAKKFEKALMNDDAEPEFDIEGIEVDPKVIEMPSGREARLSKGYDLEPINQDNDEKDVGDQHIWRYNKDGKLYRIYEVRPQMKTGGRFYEAEPYPIGIDNGQRKLKKLKDLQDFVKVATR